MNHQFRKILRIGLIMFFLLLTGFIAGLVLVYINQDKFKSVLIRELNNHIEARVEVGQIKFSLLKHFPHATLNFRDVCVLADVEVDAARPDTLLRTKELNLVFNLMKLFRKDYVVSQMILSDGYVMLYTDLSGKENFAIWKKAGQGSQGINFQLNNLQLNNLGIVYHHEPSATRFSGRTRKTGIKGNFSGRQFRLRVNSESELKQINLRKLETDKNLPFICRMEIEKNDSIWIFPDVSLNVSGLDFIVSGELHTGEMKHLSFNYEGKNLNTRTLLELLPPQMADRFRIQRSNGILELKGHIRGPYGKTTKPESAFSFDFHDAGLVLKNNPLEINRLECRGSFSNGEKHSPESGVLSIESFGADIGSGNLNGTMVIRNLLKPVITGGFTGNWQLEELNYLLPAIGKYQPAGTVRSNIRFVLHPEDLGHIGSKDIASAELSGNLSLVDLDFFTGGNRYHITGMNGDLMFSESVWFDDLFFRLNGMETRLNGRADNLLSYLFRDGKVLSIEAEAHSPMIDLERILEQPPSGEEEKQPGIGRERPVKMDVTFRIDEFRWKKFQARYAEGMLIAEPGLVLIPALGFRTMQGNVRGNGMIMEHPGHERMLHTNLTLGRLNVRDLFTGFNDFGQKFITAGHLNGTLSGELTASANFSQDWKMDKSGLMVESNVRLEKGELIDFEPLKKLSRFVEINELEHIRFDYIENNIFIKDQKVIIPQMDIFSNAFNISVTGEHGFNNYFQYRLRVLLSEILSKKAKPRLENETEFGVVQEDGLNQTSLYLLIEGTPDNYNISYDKKAVREVLKNSFQQQGREIRQIMNEEFGWFSSDSTRQETPVKTPYRISWEEKDSVTGPPLPVEKQKKKPLFRVSWEESSDTLKKK